ncbi:hypothetical protein Tco_1574745 [Tanacetum coccineum]
MDELGNINRELMSSSRAPSTPSYSAGHSTPPSYSSGPSTPPSYSSGPSTPTNYSLRSSRNGECSNCKHLRGKRFRVVCHLQCQCDLGVGAVGIESWIKKMKRSLCRLSQMTSLMVE